MTVYNREAKFREIIEGVLSEVDHEGLSVGYHLETKNLAVVCEDEENGRVSLHESSFWRLSLWVTPEDQIEGLYISASMPFSDGNEETIEYLAREVWQQYQFGSVMKNGNMDEALERVVTEVEGP